MFRAVMGTVMVLALSHHACARRLTSEPKWPPEGPAWETSPDAAFSKAREKGIPIMAFIATAG